MAKLPFMQFYTGDWLKDPALSLCSPSTRGIWIDLLAVLHELGRSGQITGTPEEIARTCRCTPAQLIEAALELQRAGAADINQGRNGELTIINRRMQREHKQRLMVAERVHRHRCNADVTQKKRSCNAGHVRDHISEEESKDSSKTDMSSVIPGQAREVFAYWQMRLNHQTAKLSSDRRRNIEARLKEGYTVEQIKAAIEGCLSSPYHQGANNQGRVWDDIELICRTGSKLENFIRLSQQQGGNGHGKALHGTRPAPRRETHNERAARETAELIEQAFAETGGDPGADPADPGEDGIAADFRRL